MDSGLYVAKIENIRILSKGISRSSGRVWTLFELTLLFILDGKKHLIRYPQPSWDISNTFAEFFGTPKDDFSKWYQLRGKLLQVYLLEHGDPIIINIIK